LGETPPTVGSNLLQSVATEAKTITIRVPNVSTYTGAGTPWSDKVNMANSATVDYWDTNTATRNNLTVALAAIGG
jgi:hypothetical protein